MLSVLIPCYNEKNTINEVLDKVLSVELPLEIIVVDDGSTDGTRELLRARPENSKIKIIFHEKNSGKGAAVITALSKATGDLVVIQDADLEYDPNDFKAIVDQFKDPNITVVYGNRWHSTNPRHSYFRFFLGGLVVTYWTNILFGARLHDEPTCYKAFRRNVLGSFKLRSRGFEFCPEVTAYTLLAGHKIKEIPIKYKPRSFEEGKKINWKDGVKALWVLTKIRFTGSW